MRVKKIKITDNAIRESLEYQSRVMKNPIMNTPNHTGISSINRYAIGYIGEWAFNEWLMENNVDGNWNPQSNGLSDKHDFLINGKTIDIKTGSNIDYKLLMFPQTQLLKKTNDFYVGVIVDLKNKVGYIHGYEAIGTIQKIKAKDFGKGIPAIAIKLEKLKDVLEII